VKSKNKKWYHYKNHLNLSTPSLSPQELYALSSVFHYPIELEKYETFIKKIESLIVSSLKNPLIASAGVLYVKSFRNLLFRVRFSLKNNKIEMEKEPVIRAKLYQKGFSYYCTYKDITEHRPFKIETGTLPLSQLPQLINHPFAGIRTFVKAKLENKI